MGGEGKECARRDCNATRWCEKSQEKYKKGTVPRLQTNKTRGPGTTKGKRRGSALTPQVRK